MAGLLGKYPLKEQFGIVEVPSSCIPGDTTIDCLEMLLEAGTRGRLVGWGIWRAMNQAVRDMGPERAQILACEIPVEWGGYTVQQRNKVCWTIKNKVQSVTIWDLWNWIKRPPRTGESARGLYMAIKSIGKEFDAKPRGLYGQGNLASPILRKEGILGHLPPPEWEMETLSRKALFGGRIQSIRIGHNIGPVYEYDINSAYSWGMLNLPSLRDCGIRKVKTNWQWDNWSIQEIEWDIPKSKQSPIYPFPVRAINGQVEYPRKGRGYFWCPIVNEAFHHWPNNIRILQSWVLGPSTSERPFTFIADLYQKRLEIDDPINDQIAKWTLSALWGKLCQRTQGGRPAEFQCLTWAGMATSIVNAELLRVAMTSPNSVWQFGVDSIISRKPPFPPDLGNNLGKWKSEKFEAIQSYQPGIWRGLREDGTWKEKTRGIPAGAFDWRTAEEEWKRYGSFGRVPVSWEEFIGLVSTGEKAGDFCSTRTVSGAVLLRPGGFKSLANLARNGAGGSRIWHPKESISETMDYSPEEGYRIDHGADTAQERI